MVSTADTVLPDPSLSDAELAVARGARGFMPDPEGLLLHRAALAAAARGPLLEIGGYCGKSAVYLGTGARAAGSVLFSVDHHRGSEENQPGELYCDEDVVDPRSGRLDTMPHFRRTIEAAGLEDTVIAVVAPSARVAAHWRTPLALLFVDGGHTEAAARGDYDGFAGHVLPGGLLLIHDVFEDPADGGQAPFHVYRGALGDGFVEVAAEGSLRVLRR